MDLPRHQRLALIRLLLDLKRPGCVEEIDTAWEEVIRARVKAVDEGRVAGIPYEQIKKENPSTEAGQMATQKLAELK